MSSYSTSSPIVRRRQSDSTWYVVFHGRQPGVYETWRECHLQTNGYPNALFKSYRLEFEARAEWRRHLDNLISSENSPGVSGATTYINKAGRPERNVRGRDIHMPSLFIGFVAGFLFLCLYKLATR